MGAGSERAQACSDFITRPSCQRKVVNCRNNTDNFPQEFVSYRPYRRSIPITSQYHRVLQATK